MSTLTLSMIVKNEEKYLSGCLNSVQGIVDEIVIVDTGSTDNTKEIASQYGAKIYDLKWRNDFSEARNFALSKSSSMWILYLDADERICESSKEIIKEEIKSGNNRGILCNVKSSENGQSRPYTMKYVRLFPNDSRLKFIGKVHEQIQPSLEKLDFPICESSIDILHLGYDVSETEMRQKAERNLKILLEEYSLVPSGYTAFQLGSTYGMLGNLPGACKFFLEATKYADLEKHYLAHSYRFIAAQEFSLRNYESAFSLINKALEKDNSPPLVNLIASKIYFAVGKKPEAENFFENAFENNQALLERKRNANYEILINKEELLYYGLNLALDNNSQRLFNFTFEKIFKTYDSPELENETYIELKLLSKLINNEHFTEQEVKKMTNAINENKLDTYLRLIPNLDSDTTKVQMFLSLGKKFGDHPSFVNAFAGFTNSCGDVKQSIKIYEAGLEKNPKDLTIALNLIALYVQENMLLEAVNTLNKSIDNFRDNQTALKHLYTVKDKLQLLSA